MEPGPPVVPQISWANEVRANNTQKRRKISVRTVIFETVSGVLVCQMQETKTHDEGVFCINEIVYSEKMNSVLKKLTPCNQSNVVS